MLREVFSLNDFFICGGQIFKIALISITLWTKHHMNMIDLKPTLECYTNLRIKKGLYNHCFAFVYCVMYMYKLISVHILHLMFIISQHEVYASHKVSRFVVEVHNNNRPIIGIAPVAVYLVLAI